MALLKLILKMFAGDWNFYVVADTTDVERYKKTLPCVFKMWCTKLGRYILGQCWMVLGILVKCPGGFFVYGISADFMG